MLIGKRIKSRRKLLDLTLEEVAKVVGITRQTIQRYESGVISNIPSDKIESLAEALKCSPAFLMGWEQPYNSAEVQSDNCLSDDEAKLISMYRIMNNSNKDKAIDYFNYLLENQKYREKETQDEVVTLQKLLEEYDAQEYTPVYTAASDGKPPKVSMLTKEQRLKILEILNDK